MASKIIVDQLQKSGLTALTLPLANATANQHLKNDGAGALSWGTGGKVLQVLEDNLNTTVSTTSTSYVASGLTVSILPASTSSKFLLVLSGGDLGNISGAAADSTFSTFYIGGVEVAEAGPYEQSNSTYAGHDKGPHSASCLHLPSTTSSVTYTVYYKVSGSTGYFNTASNRVVFTVTELSS